MTAAHGSACATAEVEVAAGAVVTRTLVLDAGLLLLSSTLPSSPKALATGVAYGVFEAAKDAEGRWKPVASSASYEGPPRFVLPAGRYRLTATHARGNVETQTTIAAGETKQLALRLLPAPR